MSRGASARHTELKKALLQSVARRLAHGAAPTNTDVQRCPFLRLGAYFGIYRATSTLG